MALNFGAASFHTKPSSPIFMPNSKHNHHLLFKFSSSSSHASSFKVAVQSEGTGGGGGGVTEDEAPSFSGSLSSARSQIDFLEQLTSTSSADGYGSEGDFSRPTIRDQLSQIVGDRDGEDFSIPLGKDLKKVTATFLTISQRRNVKRQAYLNNVSRRNDSSFFATIAAFVILPPILILVVAVLTGYVNLLP